MEELLSSVDCLVDSSCCCRDDRASSVSTLITRKRPHHILSPQASPVEILPNRYAYKTTVYPQQPSYFSAREVQAA
jgi:hypothetical protein